MSNLHGMKSSALIKYDALNRLVRFSSNKKEGRLLLKNIKRSLNNQESAFAIQNVRDQIFLLSRRDQAKMGKLIGLAGPIGKEGVTSTSLLLSLTLGELKRNRTVFIDGRMDKKNFSIYSEMFGLTKNEQIYANGCGSFGCFNSRNRNFCFLMPESGIEVLKVFSSEEVDHFISSLRQDFEYIIFDMPPVLLSSETRLLLPYLDLFYLICSARETTFQEVEKCKKIFEEVGGKISGVILNKQKIPFWTRLFGKEMFL